MKHMTDAQIYFNLIELASQKVPSLVFSLSRIEEQMYFLKQMSLKYNCHFLMATKAFPAPQVIKLADKYLSGFEISNENEFKKITQCDSSKYIFLNSPGELLNPQLIKKMRHKLIINCDQSSQYNYLNELKSNHDYTVRLNTDSLLRSSSSQSRFGIKTSNRVALQSMVQHERHNFLGFHMHHGWQKNNLKDYLKLASHSLLLSNELGCRLNLINLGGGFGNFSNKEIIAMLENIRKIIPKKVKVFFEAGRFISKNAGFAIGHVQNIVDDKNKIRVVLNLSSSCHLQWSSPKLLLAENLKNKDKQLKLVCHGPTCFEGDIIGEFSINTTKELLRTHSSIGSSLFFSNISGYSLARNQTFNGINQAEVCFIA